jgi:hypothetical protein
MKRTSLILDMVLGLFVMLVLCYSSQAQSPVTLSCSLGENTFILNVDSASSTVRWKSQVYQARF